MDEDKYPAESGRRRFVKGVVGGAALAGVGTVGSAAVNSATSPQGAGGGVTEYVGNVVVDGPAPRGMPQIPVRIDDDGVVRGVWPALRETTQGGRTVTVAETELGGVTYSGEWFQYCGVQNAPGVEPDADRDDAFRYTTGAPYEWQTASVTPGDPVTVDDFADYREWGNGIGAAGLGKPAAARWRSEGTAENLPVQVIRSATVEAAAADDEWLAASTASGFIAYLNKCTHFCCVPGFKSTGQSATFGAENLVYCPCHQSVYDPFTVERQTFVAFPRPEE
ncbi:ubiquinol-cytochrome c reductase iron-sulfur subunit [Halobaculum lipolyticum]|uniref:Ubiquinol-cytochrome c reductase iron-sulfur subunit n=1 Tax=Halobaculum lipolyticum TaxID=3032001 RepID=A0ABD5W6J6_9EURY|nr:ubiquinol-cytochrome c reductase iron-sulfur subunit [Halobaculum sp. DT31]